ncbi:ABC1-domain-containing protein [Fomitiporia mediterranea MF3/22]|uniref:ABC1-domain-containing protein n=1 Tax=Fomitiporia mediterranea (strain MF3/22) TaxID=694068 RepID=UPI000440727F|nr:ABC1-domain-containing protein [Fomitiporia mediterranea MF3/22]EJD03596.1 ABC1-domain-containing protein [Fomitiporia mediterranea MF3/22]
MSATLRSFSTVSSLRSLARPQAARVAVPRQPRNDIHGLRFTHSFPRKPDFAPFFQRARVPNRRLDRRVLWALPIVGGVALYLTPHKPLLLSSVFASPHLIPVPPRNSDSETLVGPETQHVINSPDEEGRSLLARLRRILRDWLFEPIFTARRFVHLFFIFIPVILTSPAVLCGTVQLRRGGERSGALWWYSFLVRALERAGPTFIKVAQWAASRRDIFPTELCARLGKLHSRGKPHSIQHTRRVIERVFQRPFEDVFEEFDEKPIGVGAIAQVYRATLRKDVIPPSYLDPKRPRRQGRLSFDPNVPFDPPPSVPSASVAIKILHPRVESYVSRDLKIMHFFATMISSIPGMQWLSLPEEVDVFGGMMAEQLDLRHEAQNLQTFERNFSQRKSAVSFPRPLMPFCSRDVLIEEYQTALSMESFLANGGGPYDKHVAELGLDAFLNMLLLDNFVHSDLHPGNIMVKFYRPSTRFLLKGMWSSLTGTKQSVDTLGPPPTESDHDNEVVEHLHNLVSDPPAWRAELNRLFEQGYIPEVVFIDAGLVTTLNDRNRRDFLDLFRAIAEFDGYRAGELMVERCRSPQLARDPETFALRMQHIVLQVKRKTFSLGQIKISDILIEVFRALREHHVKLREDFVNTVVSVLILEGIGRQLNPELDLFKSALPILRQLGKQMAQQERIEAVKELPKSDLGAYLKLWAFLEVRQLASGSTGEVDDLVRDGLLVPSI